MTCLINQWSSSDRSCYLYGILSAHLKAQLTRYRMSYLVVRDHVKCQWQSADCNRGLDEPRTVVSAFNYSVKPSKYCAGFWRSGMLWGCGLHTVYVYHIPPVFWSAAWESRFLWYSVITNLIISSTAVICFTGPAPVKVKYFTLLLDGMLLLMTANGL